MALLFPAASPVLLAIVLIGVVGLIAYSTHKADRSVPASRHTQPIIEGDEESDRLQALQERADRMNDFASIASHWYWETDAGMKFTQVSRSFSTYTGIPVERLTDSHFDTVLLFPRRQEQRLLSDRIASNKPFRDIHCAIALPDKTRRFLSLSGLPLFDSEARFLGYRGTGRDVTEEIAAEDRATLARGRLVDALNALDSVLMLFDADETLIVANAKMRTIFAPVAAQLHLGSKLPDVISAIAQSGLIATDDEDRKTWARTELERIRHGRSERLLRQIGDGWFQNRIHRTGEGGMLIIETDVTALIERDLKLPIANEASGFRVQQHGAGTGRLR